MGDPKCITPRCQLYNMYYDHMSGVRSQHETINHRFKSWKCLNVVFRHSIAKHATVFKAVLSAFSGSVLSWSVALLNLQQAADDRPMIIAKLGSRNAGFALASLEIFKKLEKNNFLDKRDH